MSGKRYREKLTREGGSKYFMEDIGYKMTLGTLVPKFIVFVAGEIMGEVNMQDLQNQEQQDGILYEKTVHNQYLLSW